MQLRRLTASDRTQVIDHFRAVFTDSEGEAAGAALERLVGQLADNAEDQKVQGFGAFDGESVLGAIYFSPLEFGDNTQVYMLSPVAVRTAQQGKGVGKALIRDALDQLLKQGVDVVVTYGDPAYYGKFGFEKLSQRLLNPPHPLTMPDGWLALPLNADFVPAIPGIPRCVDAFNDASLW